MQLHISQTAFNSNQRSRDFRARIDAAHAYRRLVGIDPEPYWPGMWMWELVSLPEKHSRKIVYLKSIVRLVCSTHKLTEPEFHSSARHASAVRARHIGFYLARKLTSHSFIKIGNYFHRDHTVALYAFRKVARMMEQDSALREEIERYMGELLK